MLGDPGRFSIFRAMFGKTSQARVILRWLEEEVKLELPGIEVQAQGAGIGINC